MAKKYQFYCMECGKGDCWFKWGYPVIFAIIGWGVIQLIRNIL